MKNKLYLLLLFIAAAPQAFAQNTLQYGQAEPDANFRRPYIYWDFLRYSGYDWITQNRNQPADPWKNSTKTVSRKNGDGKFIQLQNGTWVTGAQGWNFDHDGKYIFTKDANGRLTEVQDEVKNPFTDQKRKWTFEYDGQGNLEKAVIERKVGTAYQNYLQRYYFYENGVRIKDSTLLYNASNFEAASRSFYKYDASKRCTQQVVLWPSINNSAVWDTTQVINLDYTPDGRMKLVEDFTIDAQGAPPMAQYRYIYTYTSAGLPLTGTATYRNANNPTAFDENPSIMYRHYYDNQGRLDGAAMLLQNNTNTAWLSSDSIAMNYLPNGLADTGYQYKATGGIWNADPTYRLLFENVSVGIHQPPKPIGGIMVYPNPTKGILRVEMETDNGGDFTFSLTDITGKTLKTIEAYNLRAGKETIDINIEDMVPGIYFLNCGGKTLKVIKE